MADSAVVGILRAMLTADTAQFDAGMRKAVTTSKTTEKAIGGLGNEVKKLTPQAERMVKAFQGDKLLYQANNLVQAVAKVGGAAKLTESDMKRVNGTLNEAIAKYKALGQAAPKALIDTERATRTAATGTQYLNGRMVALSAAAGLMATQLAGRAIRGVVNLGREAFDSASRLVDLSAKTALSTTTLQRMEAVGVQTGVSLDTMSEAAFRLGVRLAGDSNSVEKAVGDLGLSFQRIRAMRPDQQWEAVITALSRMQNETERNRIGTELFGRSFAGIAASVTADYQKIADAAKISSDAQLQSLDLVGDRIARFRRDMTTAAQGALADALFALDELRKMSLREKLMFGAGAALDPGGASREITAQGRARAEAEANRRKEDVRLVTEQEKAQKSYAAQLTQVRAELAKLTAAQRAEIDAALQLGVNTDELEDKFGLADGTLRLYTAQLKEAKTASDKFKKSQEELAKEVDQANAAYRSFLNFVGEREIEDIGRANDAANEARKADIISDIGAQLRAIESTVDAAADAVDEKERIDAEYRQFLNDIGERMMEDERRRMEAQKAFRERYLVQFQQGIENIKFAAASNLFSMFFPGGDDGRAKEAREEYERLRKSGTASAEAITSAFRRMRDEQTSFFDRFKGWTSSILDEFKRLVDDLLGMWVREFLGGLMRSLMRSQFGQALTGWLTSAIPGLGGSIPGIGGGALAGALGLGGGSTLVGASAAPTLATLLGTAPVATGAAAAGASGAGLGAAIAGLATNPITIGAAAVLALWASGALSAGRGAQLRMEGWRRGGRTGAGASNFLGRLDRDTFLAIAGRYPRAGSFSMGGFVPPNVTMPAILHGGSHGEAIVPLQKIAEASRSPIGGSRVVQISISAIDARGVKEFVDSKAFTDSVSRVFEDNRNFIGSRVGRSLKP